MSQSARVKEEAQNLESRLPLIKRFIHFVSFVSQKEVVQGRHEAVVVLYRLDCLLGRKAAHLVEGDSGAGWMFELILVGLNDCFL